MAGSIASCIDHTDLRPQATRREIENLCGEARRYGFAAVCVNLSRAEAARLALAGSGVRLVVVAGFPLGATTTAVKVCEARQAAAAGADEIDLVINIGALKDGDCRLVEAEIRAVVDAVAPVAVKAILETCYLSNDEIIRVCRAALRAKAAFVKTSTGFGSDGAGLEQVRLMRSVVGSAAGVKASGGIRTYREALAMIEAGADRIGTSSGVRMVTEEGGDPDRVAGKK